MFSTNLVLCFNHTNTGSQNSFCILCYFRYIVIQHDIEVAEFHFQFLVEFALDLNVDILPVKAVVHIEKTCLVENAIVFDQSRIHCVSVRPVSRRVVGNNRCSVFTTQLRSSRDCIYNFPLECHLTYRLRCIWI